MAYPTIDAPYGLVPVKLLSGVPFVGLTRQYSIASGYGTNIFHIQSKFNTIYFKQLDTSRNIDCICLPVRTS